jgi:hypothetical protein
MKNLMNRMPAAAALLVLTGAVASAQTEMKVDVPFTFHTVGATMAPGKYVITKVPTGATPYYRLRHENGKSVLVVAANMARPTNASAQPEVAFTCAGEYCALKAIQPGFGLNGIELPVRMKPGFRGEKVAEVRIPIER